MHGQQNNYWMLLNLKTLSSAWFTQRQTKRNGERPKEWSVDKDVDTGSQGTD
jgi:hypothetical protein